MWMPFLRRKILVEAGGDLVDATASGDLLVAPDDQRMVPALEADSGDEAGLLCRPCQTISLKRGDSRRFLYEQMMTHL